jgi:hypothetical protein
LTWACAAAVPKIQAVSAADKQGDDRGRIHLPFEAAYRRGDLFQKRRQLAEAWSRFCTAPVVAGELLVIGAAR